MEGTGNLPTLSFRSGYATFDSISGFDLCVDNGHWPIWILYCCCCCCSGGFMGDSVRRGETMA